jgi:hypothetical protein
MVAWSKSGEDGDMATGHGSKRTREGGSGTHLGMCRRSPMSEATASEESVGAKGAPHGIHVQATLPTQSSLVHIQSSLLLLCASSSGGGGGGGG